MTATIISDLSGEMQFEMTEEKTAQLIGNSCCYSSEFKCEPDLYEEAAEAVKDYAEKNEPVKVPVKPLSRVDRMFGDYKSRIPVESGTVPLKKPDENKGFLLCECWSCGSLRGFYAKHNVPDYNCYCGSSTPLKDLRPVHIHCQKCGSGFKYMTNIKRKYFSYSCLNCSAPVDLELNKTGTAYITVGWRCER